MKPPFDPHLGCRLGLDTVLTAVFADCRLLIF